MAKNKRVERVVLALTRKQGPNEPYMWQAGGDQRKEIVELDARFWGKFGDEAQERLADLFDEGYVQVNVTRFDDLAGNYEMWTMYKPQDSVGGIQ